MSYNKGSEATKFYNLSGTITSSQTHVVKLGAGLLSHVVVNYVSGSGTDDFLKLYDGYMSSSFSASVAQPLILSGQLIGTVRPTFAGTGEEFEYGLVLGTGLVAVIEPTGSVDFSIIYE